MEYKHGQMETACDENSQIWVCNKKQNQIPRSQDTHCEIFGGNWHVRGFSGAFRVKALLVLDSFRRIYLDLGLSPYQERHNVSDRSARVYCTATTKSSSPHTMKRRHRGDEKRYGEAIEKCIFPLYLSQPRVSLLSPTKHSLHLSCSAQVNYI
jgi:hypothetical protein